MNNHQKALRIVAAILNDLSGRKGIGNELEQIDHEVYRDMNDELITITEEILAT